MKRKVLIVAILPLVLAGCFGSGGGETPTSASSPSSTGASPSATHVPLDPGNVYVDVDNSQGEGDYVGALTDMVASSCAGDGGVLYGSGTVKNPSDVTVNYRIWVSFIDSDGETIGLVQDNVDGIDPGQQGDFATQMPYTGSDAVTCVYRVERRVATEDDGD